MIKILGNRKTFLGFLIFFALIFMLAMKVKRSPSSVFFVKRIEDVRGAMAYLLDECKEKDILYIHSSMHEQFKLYADVYRISSKVVIHGNIGWPCCPREDSNDRFLKTAEFMPAEINRLIRPEKEYRIRFLFTDRFNHWKYLRRNDPENFNKSLEQIGCAKISSVTRYRNVRIDEYLCKTGE